MTTEKRELGTISIIDGPSLHGVLTSLSIALPPPDGSGIGDSSHGFPVSFHIKLEPREGQRSAVLLVVVTSADDVEYDYCNYVLTGYFKKSSRNFLCSYFKLPITVRNGLADSIGWLTFRAKYHVHSRKGEMTIEYSDENPWFISRDIKRYD
jgi:hypothetical protein